MSTALKSFRNMSDEEALARAQDIYTYYSGAKKDDLARYDRYMAMYKAKDNPEAISDRSDEEAVSKDEQDPARYSNNKIAFGAAQVDATVNWLFNYLFPNDNYFKIDADNFNDEIAAMKVTAHLQKRHKEMKFLRTMEEVLTETAIADYSITGVRWRVQPGYIPETQRTVEIQRYGKAAMEYKRNRIVERWVPDAIDRSDIFRIPYDQCYHDPDAKGGFDQSYAFCDYRYETVEDFLGRAESKYRPWGIYKPENVKKVIKYVKANMQDGSTSIANSSGEEDTDPKRAFMNFRLMIKRVWTRDHVLEYFEDMLIWRKNLTGWPLQRWGVFVVPNQFPMMGILQRIERNEYDINEKLNTRQDYVNLIVDPWVILSTELADEADELYHGKILYAKNPKDAAYVYQPGTNPTDASLADVKVQVDFMDRTGISPEGAGAHPRGDRTATETNAVTNGTMAKVKRISRRLEDECLVPIYQYQFLLEGIFLSKEERTKYYGQFGEMVFGVRPEDYAWNSMPIFMAKGTSEMIDEPVRIQQFMTAMDRAMAAPQFHNLKNIFAEMWRIFAPKNFHRFVKDPSMDNYKIPPEEENKMFALGRIAEISPLDDDQKHVEVHEKYKRTPDYLTWPERTKMEFEAHIRAHQAKAAGAGMAGGAPAQPGRSNALTASNVNEQRGVRSSLVGVTP